MNSLPEGADPLNSRLRREIVGDLDDGRVLRVIVAVLPWPGDERRHLGKVAQCDALYPA